LHRRVRREATHRVVITLSNGKGYGSQVAPPQWWKRLMHISGDQIIPQTKHSSSSFKASHCFFCCSCPFATLEISKGRETT